MYLARIEAYDQSTKLNGHLVLTKQKVQSQALRLSVAIWWTKDNGLCVRLWTSHPSSKSTSGVWAIK